MSELCEAFGIVKDVITSLVRVSIIIRDATPRDRYMKSSTSTSSPLLDLFDIAHVGHKFPKIDRESQHWLKERLGRAITQRRQYLKYCRDHHDKFQGPQDEKLSSARVTTNIDNLVLDQEPFKLNGTVRSLPTSAFAPTDASTLPASKLKALDSNLNEATEDAEDSQSQTSYATSVHDSQGGSKMYLPSLKDVTSVFPFECPYCWKLQDFMTERSWK